MAKIRVQDLARSMGLDNQDLVFKLRSIGVRVEGDEALIDTDIIQAILQGKRLPGPGPREVILRDDSTPPPPPTSKRPTLRRPTGARPRRSMIQKVERPIREIEVRQKPFPEMGDQLEADQVPGVEQSTPAMPSLEAGEVGGRAAERFEPVRETSSPVSADLSPSAQAKRPAPNEVAAGETAPTPPVSAPSVSAPPVSAPSVSAPPVSAKPESAPPVSAKPESAPPVSAPPVSAKPVSAKPVSTKPVSAKPVSAKPAQRPGDTGATRSPAAGRPASTAKRSPSGNTERRGAVLISRPNEGAPPVPRQSKAAPPPKSDPRSRKDAGRARPLGDSRKDGTAARPASRHGADPRRGRRGEKTVQPFDERRARPSEPEEKRRQPVSARGKRRAQRRKEDPVRTTSGLQFKEERPSGPVTIAEGMTVREFAEKLGVKAKDLIRALVVRGIMANINHVLDMKTAKSLADELGVEVMEVSFEEEVQLHHESNLEDVDAQKESRAPVVTVMGHVDHGKTTLLDRIRSAKVAEGEAGGITQHIGAYHVDVEDRQIVFLDTPGHEAFTMMRARGARVTDVVVLVVAADDSVMPQTIEAINHAKAGNVPIVVAINKIDKANANLDRVRKELADQGLVVEDWGGDVVSVPISALRGEGVDALLEMILLTSDLLELQASPSLPAHGVVLEARKEVGRGTVATVLVQNGTLRTGDVFVAGSTWGKVRIMTNDRGKRLKSAGPSTPVEITGFTEVPGAGDLLQVMDDESKARSIAELRREEERKRELRPSAGRMSLEQLFSQGQDETKELPIIIKADVDGSVEVLRETLRKLSTEKVQIKILHAAVGGISDNDVIFASASNAIIVGFNVRPEKSATTMAEKEGIDIRLHTVIYELQDELKMAMTGLLEPVFREVHVGTAEVRNTFKVPKVGVVAGAHIVDGHIPRSANLRLIRDSRVIWEGRIGSLKRFKEDVPEVRSGFDCGIGLERFQDIKPGDSLEAFTREEVAPTL